MRATILLNKARCDNCGDVIESKHVHDYVSCSCGRLAVDGGHEYLRRNFSPSEYTDLSLYGCPKCGKVLTNDNFEEHMEQCKPQAKTPLGVLPDTSM